MSSLSLIRILFHMEGQGDFPIDPRTRVGTGRHYTSKEDIDSAVRYRGMLTVDDDENLYMLKGGILNSNYTKVSATDHHELQGLSDDDHPQYHNDSRAASWIQSLAASDSMSLNGSGILSLDRSWLDAAPLTTNLDSRYVPKSGGIFTGSVTFQGGVVIQGDPIEVNAEINTTDAVLLMNNGEVGNGVTLGYAGFEIDRGIPDNYWFGFDENRELFTIGQISSLSPAQIALTQAVATREDNPTDGHVMTWDAATSRLVGVSINSIAPIPTLQSVTDVGSVTTNSITVANLTLSDGIDRSLFIGSATVGESYKIEVSGDQLFFNYEINGLPGSYDWFMKYRPSTGTLDFSGATSFTGQMTVGGDVRTTGSFIKIGGTSSQFLKADGTLDSNTYALASALPTDYVPASTGGVFNGDITVNSSLNTFSGRFTGSGTTNLLSLGSNVNGGIVNAYTSGFAAPIILQLQTNGGGTTFGGNATLNGLLIQDATQPYFQQRHLGASFTYIGSELGAFGSGLNTNSAYISYGEKLTLYVSTSASRFDFSSSGISTPAHGTSADWKVAYDWVNTNSANVAFTDVNNNFSATQTISANQAGGGNPILTLKGTQDIGGGGRGVFTNYEVITNDTGEVYSIAGRVGFFKTNATQGNSLSTFYLSVNNGTDQSQIVNATSSLFAIEPALQVNSTITATGTIQGLAYYMGATQGTVLSQISHYNIVHDPQGASRIFVGGTGDPNNYYDNTAHFFRNASGVLNTTISSSGITTVGGTSTQWNTAYTYSQVGHLPLSGGTLTGDLVVNGTRIRIVDGTIQPDTDNTKKVGSATNRFSEGYFVNLYGNGSGLTSVNASNISSGTLTDSRLSSNVALKNIDNSFVEQTVSNLKIPNGNYLRLQRSSGGLYLDTLGSPTGTDDVRLVTSGAFNVVNGSLTTLMSIANNGNTTINGTVNLLNNSGIYFSGTQTLFRDATYTMLKNPVGALRIYLGSGGDDNNYYDGGGHIFRNEVSSNLFTITSAGQTTTYSQAAQVAHLTTTATSIFQRFDDASGIVGYIGSANGLVSAGYSALDMAIRSQGSNIYLSTDGEVERARFDASGMRLIGTSIILNNSRIAIADSGTDWLYLATALGGSAQYNQGVYTASKMRADSGFEVAANYSVDSAGRVIAQSATIGGAGSLAYPLILKGSQVSGNNYVQFRTSANTDLGYIGYGGGIGNNHMYFYNHLVGDIYFYGNAGVNTYVNNTLITSVTSSGLTVSGQITATDITATNNISVLGTVLHNTTSTRDKYRVWSSSEYTIGMGYQYTYGGLNDYAMTFQMDTTANRGWWWGTTGHTNAQGAMSLTNTGVLVVANSIRVGYGTTDTSAATGGYQLQVSGTSNLVGNVVSSGSMSAANFIDTSDSRLKTELKTPVLGMELVRLLKPKRYIKGGVEETGFYADKLPTKAEYIRELMVGGYWGIRYKDLLAVHTKALQEVDHRLSDMEKVIKKLGLEKSSKEEVVRLESRIKHLEELIVQLTQN